MSESKVANKAAPDFKYADDPLVRETFADSIHSLTFDGQSLRINFSVTRLNEVSPNQPASGTRHPCCRMVLTPSAANDLIKHIQQIANALSQAAPAQPMSQERSSVPN